MQLRRKVAFQLSWKINLFKPVVIAVASALHATAWDLRSKTLQTFLGIRLQGIIASAFLVVPHQTVSPSCFL